MAITKKDVARFFALKNKEQPTNLDEIHRAFVEVAQEFTFELDEKKAIFLHSIAQTELQNVDAENPQHCGYLKMVSGDILEMAIRKLEEQNNWQSFSSREKKNGFLPSLTGNKYIQEFSNR
eukprot:GHVP01004474.1.p1 GENE.GHVP01004474.1~~GHVP01004474.1.p1  ORF type:complete len:121 (+),score=26.76 GHVP01004474.1:859-1221(+)